MKKQIRFAGLLLCASVLIAGCSAQNAGSDGGQDRDPEVTAETTEAEAPAPDAPANLKTVYQKDQKALKFTWSASEGASRYEVKNGTDTTIAITNETLVYNVEEGDKGTLFVRAVGPQGQVSEWSDIDYAVEVHLDAPDATYRATDGNRSYVYWSPVEGASAYEVVFYGDDKNTTLNIPYPYSSFYSPLEEGQVRQFDIRSVKTIRNQNYYSDWQKFNYTDPKFKALTEYNFYESSTLDYNRLKEWARVKGYTFTSNKEGDNTIVEITFKDDVNSKLWARIKRAAKDMFNAAIEGYDDGLFDLGNSVEAFRESQKKWKTDFFEKLNEKAEEDAKQNAIIAGIKSVFTNVYVNCRYCFSNTNKAPEMCMVALVKNNRENYAKDFAAQHKPDSDGVYKFVVDGSLQNYYMMIDQNDNYWCVYLMPEHIK